MEGTEGGAPTNEGGITNQTATIPNTIGTSPAESTTADLPEFSTIVPADYQDAAWIKDVPDIPTFFKNHSDMKSAMGRKSYPGHDASPEEFAEFASKFGMESPDKYELTPIAEDHPQREIQIEYQSGIRELFHKAGLHPQQAAILDKGHADLMKTLNDKANGSSYSQEGFDKVAEEAFGDRKAEVTANMTRLVAQHGGDVDDLFSGLSNEDFVKVAGIFDKIYTSKYTESEIPNGGEQASSGRTEEDRREALAKLYAHPAFKDELHPEHESKMKEWHDLYK